MTAVASPPASSMQKRCAQRLEEWDEHAIIGVDGALSLGVTLEDLGLLPENLHKARIRFVRHALTTYLFEGSDRHLIGRVLAYLETGAVSFVEVSVRQEDQEILRGFLESHPPAEHELRTILSACDYSNRYNR